MSIDTPHDLLRRWEAAEAAADPDALADLLAEDFRGVGPLGFVLDRDQWLARFAGGLTVASFTLTDVDVREHDPLAVAVGVQTQSVSYRGRPNDGRFRASLVMRRTENARLVLGVHLSGPIPDGVP